jgi:DNA repair protein RadD
MIFQNRYYQTDAENSVFNYFESGNTGNPLVAMPTGTGKSHVIANIIKRIFTYWPNQKIMMLTHVKELIVQNAEKLQDVWPVAPLGIYSAGLNSRDMIMPIIYGGIQSVANAIKQTKDENKPEHLKHFGWRDLIFIDEAHLLSPNDASMYQFVISELKRINPYLKVIGFSATPYRLKQGMLTDDGLFTDICYDITKMDQFNRLIYEGYLSPLITKPTKTEFNLSSVSITDNEYNQKQMEAVFDVDKLSFNACQEIINESENRISWLIFCSGINHSEHIASILQSMGIDAITVHSKLKDKENDARIKAFKNFEFKALVSNNKMTTGFDHPPVDLIAHLRATLSPAFHVQTNGRGTRPSLSTGKQNCKVLDFAGNIKRLGPINDVRIPTKPGKKKQTGDVPIKICEYCGFYNHTTARVCCNCGAEFSFKSKLVQTASTAEIIKTSDEPIYEFFNVQKVLYNLHEKKKDGILQSPPSIKVSYICGLRMFNEWICLEHKGLAQHKAKEWWKSRHGEEPPPTTYQALQRVSELRVPTKLMVHINKPYPEIKSYEY